MKRCTLWHSPARRLQWRCGTNISMPVADAFACGERASSFNLYMVVREFENRRVQQSAYCQRIIQNRPARMSRSAVGFSNRTRNAGCSLAHLGLRSEERRVGKE